MTTGAFLNISGLTHEMQLTMWDFDPEDTGATVWRAAVGDEERFIEAPAWSDAWSLFDKACHAFDRDNEDEVRDVKEEK